MRTIHIRLMVLALLVGLLSDRAVWSQTFWTESQFSSTPEPPPPFRLKRAFPALNFMGPVSVHRFPDEKRLVVVEQNGAIYSFDATDDNQAQADLMVSFAETPPRFAELDADQGLYLNVFSLAFHPDFKSNRYVYICYLIQKGGAIHPDGTHIARFEVTDTDPPRIDLDSEFTILRCDAGGHNGCTLVFGPDGYLYVSIGDLADPTPPDPLKTGQDISDLYASILRIDVDEITLDEAGKVVLNYRIPPDNPFVRLPNARPEVYAYGLRNPWRMSFDEVTGDLWVGDVGWERFEMVYRAVSGGNYGWAIKEGPGDVMLDLPVGPTPILPADIVFSHADAASVTGGVVYRGSAFPELQGQYLFGDWITCRFWSAGFNEAKVDSPIEIVRSNVKPICFELDHEGEVLVLEYVDQNQASGLWQIERAPVSDDHSDKFPRKLSESGLFRDASNLHPASGVYSYQVNAPMWNDGGTAVYHVGIPGPEPMRFFQWPQKTFDWFNTRVSVPLGTVYSRTIRYPVQTSDGTTFWKPIETQVSQFMGVIDWRYYTYRWLEDGSDAVLVPSSGERFEYSIPASDGSSIEILEWNFVSRNQCAICHTPWSGDSLGFNEWQLRRPNESTDSFRQLVELGMLTWEPEHTPAPDDKFVRMFATDETDVAVHLRARSYLHVNCAHCHQLGGNGSAAFDIRLERSLEETNAIDVVPMKGDCGLESARLIAPGAPEQSVILYRMLKSGSGHMPHIGPEGIDVSGVRLINQWISALPRKQDERAWLEELQIGYRPANPDGRQVAINQMLETNAGALRLGNAILEGAIQAEVKSEIMAKARGLESARAELFETFLPASERVKRLGNDFDPRLLLDREGDSERGRMLFASGVGQCNRCHRVGEVGLDVGPKLDQIATKWKDQATMLEQIVAPSRKIDEEFASYVFLLDTGEIHVGRIVKKDDDQVILQNAEGVFVTIEMNAIEQSKKSDQSLMPEGLLAGLTSEQATDLLAYLMSLH